MTAENVDALQRYDLGGCSMLREVRRAEAALAENLEELVRRSRRNGRRRSLSNQAALTHIMASGMCAGADPSPDGL
jgi:hypothetical protein